MNELLTVIGLILILEGMPYFAFPRVFKKWIVKVLEMPEGSLRIYGLVSMLVGLLLVYLARRSGFFN
ncbi:MAG: DUF2065 domain-containing protein [Desulfobacterota bacterium]|jgi:hypothetical protein|nr:DUF2065 domain-containing protein [Thermodesulfobacteriota bacterium]